ncbi:MAG: transglutaminase domain-containing protein [Lachnospiraceae bacterium]|nr:transglutaminase domain-containing protein [Lachnospiraceae bacterium]
MKEEKQFIFEEELTDFIYRSVFTAVIAVFMFLEIYNAVDHELITRGNVFAVILISISFNALLLLYRRVKIYLIPAFAVVALIMYIAIDKDDVRLILESSIFSIFLITLAAFGLFLLCDRFTVLNAMLAGGVLIYMVCELTMDFDMQPASPALGLFYVLTALIRILRKSLKPEPCRTRKYITFLLPFILSFLLILLILPKPGQPISWRWVSNIYEYTSEKLNVLVHRLSNRFGSVTSESFKITFDKNERMIYDNSRTDETELFEITPDGTVFGSMYLKGATYNRFENGQWLNTIENNDDLSRIDAFETRLGVQSYSEVSSNSLIRENNVNIKVLDMSTTVVFAPAKMTSFSDINVKRKTKAVNEYLLFDRNAPYAGEYKVSFLQMNIGNTVFNDYMNSTGLNDDPEEFEIVKRNFQGKYNDLTYDDLTAYRRYVEENYTSAPQIRDSVKKWLEAVWEEAAYSEEKKKILSGYEKLAALEQALSLFKYDLNVGGLPGYVKTEGDFIDYFILEKREGYCVHYATVFCLLARYLGYPARIVQGYKVEAVMNVPSKVIDGCGHAWPEVYFKGKGWIPFEPTPGMGGFRYAGWAVMSGRIKTTDSFHREKEDEAAPIPNDAEYEREHRENYASGVLFIAIAGIFILSIILLVAARIFMRRRKMKRMDAISLYKLEFGMIEQVLAQFGIKRESFETLTEFGNRAEKELTDSMNKEDAASLLMPCVGSYENYLYGEKIPGDDETEKLRNCRYDLEAQMKEYFGRKYWIHKLKLMIERNII